LSKIIPFSGIFGKFWSNWRYGVDLAGETAYITTFTISLKGSS
jgi:hypothetical protein